MEVIPISKVSVILTSYNKPGYVAKSIESVLNQTYADFELLIMDDNSNEETKKEIRKYKKHEKVKIFYSNINHISERVKKVRYAVQINRALKKISGEYVSYITDDNIYLKHRLEKMVNFLTSRADAQIVYSSSHRLIVDESDNITDITFLFADKITRVAPCRVDHCSVLHRASILPVLKSEWGNYWDEDPQYYLIGDARFFWRLNHHWAFYPINEVLDINYITKQSLHSDIYGGVINSDNPILSMLPPQNNCGGLITDLHIKGMV